MTPVALLIFAAIAAGQPTRVPLPLESAEAAGRVSPPIRCRPAPYLVAERTENTRAERILVTGSRVPLVSRDYAERPSPPCWLMQDRASPPNPLRSAD